MLMAELIRYFGRLERAASWRKCYLYLHQHRSQSRSLIKILIAPHVMPSVDVTKCAPGIYLFQYSTHHTLHALWICRKLSSVLPLPPPAPGPIPQGVHAPTFKCTRSVTCPAYSVFFAKSQLLT